MTIIKATVQERRLAVDVPSDWPDGLEVEMQPLVSPLDQQRKWEQVRNNPSLFEGSLLPGEGERLRWHTHAESCHSSQVICVSAFGTLRHLSVRDAICTQFLLSAEMGAQARASWEITLEKEQPELLNELGTEKVTSIDALFISSDSVFCLEAKFLSDARNGFGKCSQPATKCAGFYGPDSDLKTNTPSWCRLETWEGNRSPRLYWSLGRSFFQETVFRRQRSGDRCPFNGPNFQLMRNFLFAATLAQRTGKRSFGVVVVCPRVTSGRLQDEVELFRDSVLLPAYRNCVQTRSYEDYVQLLEASGNQKARRMADFLDERLQLLPDCLPVRARIAANQQVNAIHQFHAIMPILEPHPEAEHQFGEDLMPIYFHRGGRSYGAVVAGEGIVPGRFVYLSKTEGEMNSWRIRDFITGRGLSSDDCPNVTLNDIEQLVELDHDQVPKLNANAVPAQWADWLSNLSQETFGENYSADSPPTIEPLHWRDLPV